MKLNNIIRSVLFAPLLSLASCATMVNGTMQPIAITSNPTNANVYIDSMHVGKTPVQVSLTRANEHFIKIELDGYHPFELQMKKKMSGWVLGNLLIGDIAGVIVDNSTGSIYKLSPQQVTREFGSMSATSNHGTTTVAVVLEADSSWQKIAQLERR